MSQKTTSVSYVVLSYLHSANFKVNILEYERQKFLITIKLLRPFSRYVTFKYAREEVLHGLTAYRYETRSSMLDNGEEDSANSCFCGGECAPPGALNVSTCRLGAPAFVSFPHFYMADSVYRDGVIGMRPDPKRHGAHITMEPVS